MGLKNHWDKDLQIPKIVPFLAEAVLRMNGQQSEGIFRVPGDAEEITDLVSLQDDDVLNSLLMKRIITQRIRIENGNYDISGITDPNVPASLLKYWLRDLAEPLIPTKYYDQCIQHAENPEKAIAIVDALPEVNRRIIQYMILFVQVIIFTLYSRPDPNIWLSEIHGP